MNEKERERERGGEVQREGQREREGELQGTNGKSKLLFLIHTTPSPHLTINPGSFEEVRKQTI